MEYFLRKASTLMLAFAVASHLPDGASAAPAADDPVLYGPLQCNLDASVDSDECLANAVGLSELLGEHDDDDDASPLIVPCGTCVVVDYEDGSTVTVDGGLHVIGRLHFPPEASVVLRTTAVYVQGTWSMATPATGNAVTLSLYGTEEPSFVPFSSSIGTKPFVVAGGRLDIRAIDESCPSWTALLDMDPSSLDSLTVDPDFAGCLRPGDDLLLTSDTDDFDGHHTAVIDSVDAATGVVLLREPAARLLPSAAGPGEPEFAAEVALLRRDVVFVAETDPVDDRIGGHSIVWFTPGVVQTIEGVRFENFGQEGILGRYPIHFHKSGLTNSLVSKNVITRSNQRCVFIHDTDGVTIDDNVAFDTTGHCYATETGSERLNVFTRNLGAFTQKMTRSNGQSDSEGFELGQTATFWIRNMENTFVGNVAAGCDGSGYWLEMKDKYTNQLSEESFRDNVAHSNHHGIVTYKKGWLPGEPAYWDDLRIYRNYEGFKFHITGNLTVRNALIADNENGVRYGVWNQGVTFEDTLFVGASADRQLRVGVTCPRYWDHGIKATMNMKPDVHQNIALKNVTFSDYNCGARTIYVFDDGRQQDDMGDPLRAHDVRFVDTDESSRPKMDYCDESEFDLWFMEDADGTMGPNGKGPGFFVRDNGIVDAFLPENSCDPMPYGEEGCAAFCEDVCLRLVHVAPSGRYDPDLVLVLRLTESSTGAEADYPVDGGKDGDRAIAVLPAGDYAGEFFDAETGISVTVDDDVDVLTFAEPRCGDPFDGSTDVVFRNVAAPTEAPTFHPTRYHDMSYGPAIVDGKCPSDDRLVKNTDVDTLEGCHALCFGMPGCNFFSYWERKTMCITCSLDSASELSTDRDFVAHELTSIRDPSSDFGYELWRGDKGIDEKCPMTGDDRLGKIEGLTDRKECYRLCNDTPGCGWFSWGEDHAESQNVGTCLLCSDDGNLEGHNGLYTYEMI